MIVVAEGTESGAVVRSACPNAMVVHESYVVRRSRALRAGRLVPAERPPPKPTPSRKRARAAPVTGEKRGARYRSMSAAGAARIERALTERLYLIERRDVSTASESGLVAHRHEFAVLGSTGNAYEVAICRKPSCTCAKAAQPHAREHTAHARPAWSGASRLSLTDWITITRNRPSGASTSRSAARSASTSSSYTSRCSASLASRPCRFRKLCCAPS